MPTVPFQSYLRLTHTGLRADGGANTSSIIINDLDVGFENQNRKSPVYIPVGGFIDVPLTGASQTYAIQFASQNNTATVSCRRARLGFFRVS